MKIAALASQLVFATYAMAEYNQECPAQPPLEKEEILIAWLGNSRTSYQIPFDKEPSGVTLGSFRPFAILKDKTIVPYPGASIRRGQRFWPMLGRSKPVRLDTVGSFYDHLNDGNCVYFATIEGSAPPPWTLLSSSPLHGLLHQPTYAEATVFYQANKTCVYHEEKSPCTRPKLLAVSDVDVNGAPEYWVADPYAWDMGLSIYEYQDELRPIIMDCPGCAD